MQKDFDNFLQTVWDNANKNVRTATGFNTYHALAGIAMETPKRNPPEKVLKRSPLQNRLTGSFGTPLYVVDGGYLMHKFVWPEGATYRQILQQHVDYVHRHFGKNVIIVMDGYGDENCIKTSTRKVRATKYVAQEISFDLSMKTVTTQETFLGNQLNKAGFISKLVEFLEDADIQVKQAMSDADPLIVSCFTEFTSCNCHRWK